MATREVPANGQLDPPASQESILTGVSRAAQVLLSVDDWTTSVDRAIGLLGQTTGADRVYIFENYVDDAGRLVTGQRFEWTSSGVSAQIDNDNLVSATYQETGFGRWEAVLGNGGVIAGRVGEFPESERELLEQQGIVTLAVVPIMARSSWWGFLGLDDTGVGRDWGEAELEALRAAAALIGSAIERQWSAQALADSEKKFRYLIENGFDAVSIVDPEGRFLYSSSSVAKITGYEPGEMRGSSVFDFIHPEDLQTAAQILEAVLVEPEISTNLDVRARHKDGSWRWLHAAATNFLDEPAVQGIVINFHDITSRKQVELELRRRQSEYQALVENSPDVIVRVDTDGRILFLNSAAERILSLSLADLIGKRPEEIEQFKLIAPHWRANTEELLQKQSDLESQFPLDTPTGTIWLNSRSVPEFGQNGQVESLLISARDVTERVKAVQRVKESEEHFRRLIEYSSDMIAIVGADSSSSYLSPNISRVLGYPVEDILGDQVLDYVHADDVQNVVGTLAGAVQSFGSIVEVDFRIRHLKGHYVWFAARGRAVEQDGEIKVIVNAHDITARRAAESEVQKTEQRFKSLVQNASDIITIVDADGIVMYESPALESVLGYPPEAVVGLPVFDPIHPDDRGHSEQAIRRLAEGASQSELFSIRIQDVHGNWRVLEVVAEDMLHEPAVDGIVITSRDVTERQQQLERLETVAAFSAALRKANSASEMPPIIEGQLRELLNVDGVVLSLRDRREGEVVVDTASGEWEGSQQKRYLTAGHERLPLDPDEHGLIWRSGLSERISPPDTWLRSAYPSTIGVQLVSGTEPVGELWIGRDSEITDHEISLLTAVADMTANALQRANLHEETMARANQLAEVGRLGETLGSSLQMILILERLAHSIHALLPEVSTVFISRYDPDEETITAAFGLHEGQPIDVMDLPPIPLEAPGVGTQSEVIRTGQPMIISDFQNRLEKVNTNVRIGEGPGEGPQSALMVPMLARGHVIGVVQAQSESQDRFSHSDAELLSIVANTAAVAINNADLLLNIQGTNVELSLAYEATLEGWARALEMRDQETEGHTRRVVDKTLRLAVELGVPADQLIQIRRGAMMHDIGKMAIPDSILLKPGPLDEAEWEIMRRHPEHAYNMLSQATYLEPALEIPYYHHEKWDGTGYPKGLSGDQIPFSARIFAVIDVWDALCSDRPYRNAWPAEKARQHIQAQAGSHFDPAVVSTFVTLLDEGHLG